MYAKNSNTAITIQRGVIRDEVGRYKLRQCNPRICYQRPVSRWVVVSNNKTVGDVLNKLSFNNNLRSLILNK